jgi:beta-galactosidase
MFTCGWTKGYDVFIQARQHGGCKKVKDLPCVVSEYGDWEYFAQNAGLEQHQWKDLQPAERNSRQLRGDGEVRLLQQALNFQEAHNDNLKTTAFADGIWVMFDYNRGYAPDIEASGVMDIFRLPKFGYWFFRSQRDPGELIAGKPVGPMVYIANYWTPGSPREVRVFSNCEEVALMLNGKLIERRRPDTNRVATQLKHAPFTFNVERFAAGTLRAVGFIGGKEVTRHERRTPETVAELRLAFDTGGRPFAASGKDQVFCRAELVDARGEINPTMDAPVYFGATGDARLVGEMGVQSEGGIATTLVGSDTASPAATVYALCVLNENGETRILSSAASPNGGAPGKYTVCYTTDGSAPTAKSATYSKPVKTDPKLQAGIFVDEKLVLVADPSAPAATTAGRGLTAGKGAGQ